MTTAAAERNICRRCGRFLREHERGVGDTAPYGIERSVPVGQRGDVGIAPDGGTNTSIHPKIQQ